MNPFSSFFSPQMLIDFALSFLFTTLREAVTDPIKAATMRKIFLKVAKSINEVYGKDEEFSAIGKMFQS